MAIDDAFLAKWSESPFNAAPSPLIVEYLRTGNAAVLAQLRGKKWQSELWMYSVHEIMGPQPGWQVREQRMIAALAAGGHLESFLRHVGWNLEHELPDIDTLGAVMKLVAPADRTAAEAAVFDCIHDFTGKAGPNSAGRWVLACPDTVLKPAVLKLAGEWQGRHLLTFVGRYAAPRMKKWLPEVLALKNPEEPELPFLALAGVNPAYEVPLRDAWRKMPDGQAKFNAGVPLAKINPAQYERETFELGLSYLRSGKKEYSFCTLADWMLDRTWEEALPEVLAVLPKILAIYGNKQWEADSEVLQVVRHVAESVGTKAVPLFNASLELGLPRTQDQVLTSWVALGPSADRTGLLAAFERVFKEEEWRRVVAFVKMAVAWDLAAVEALLWNLTAHSSKPVRGIAARSLARLGGKVEARAIKLLGERKAGPRHAGTILLCTLNTPGAVAALDVHLETESDPDISDEILRGLEASWRASGKTLSLADIQKRIDRSANKWKKPPAQWIQLGKLPVLKYRDGKQVGADAVAYILYRQSRAKEIAADLEAKPLYERIDRKSSGDFALLVLEGYLKSGADATDRWAMSLAGILGDDRIVRLLLPKISEWAKASRGKLAEYAVQALALLGTDHALMAVDATAIRFRVKLKNIGKAATEAFNIAAETAGLTPDELGDRVVPWLGFESGKHRLVTVDTMKIRVSIGPDFKLRLQNDTSGKRIVKLPAAAAKETAAELKEITASLKEIAKAQCLRMENLLVRQRRWPAAIWRSMFLQHPLLMPFGVRLVWGAYGPSQQLIGSFRGLEDGSLTNAEDDPFELPKQAEVCILHPMQLPKEAQAAWNTHLADNEIEPPFPQMDRAVILVKPELRDLRLWKDFKGTDLNAMTFKGRAERLGWNRGSVVDGGGITFYWKSFPAGGVDAFLGVDGMYIGIDMYSSIQLGDLLFVRGGSVKVASYTYDEPGDEKDPRLVTLGEVPPIVYSETMGDLRKIAGAKSAEAADDRSADAPAP